MEEVLPASGYDETANNKDLSEYRGLKNAKRLSAGFVCLGVGAFLGFISCVLTLINAVPALYAIILYGLIL